MPPVRRPAVGAPGHEPDSFGLAFTVTSATVSSSALAAGVVADRHVHATFRARCLDSDWSFALVPACWTNPCTTVRMPRFFTCFSGEFALNPLPDETAVG